MTTNEIFSANQVLTLDIAKTLIGKTIAITNPEYKMNRPSVRIFKLTGITSEFDLAAHQDCPGYNNRQEYWIKQLPNKIKEFKRRLKLVGEGDIPYATCDTENRCLSPFTFFGSDADREIYYVVIS